MFDGLGSSVTLPPAFSFVPQPPRAATYEGCSVGYIGNSSQASAAMIVAELSVALWAKTLSAFWEKVRDKLHKLCGPGFSLLQT